MFTVYLFMWFVTEHSHFTVYLDRSACLPFYMLLFVLVCAGVVGFYRVFCTIFRYSGFIIDLQYIVKYIIFVQFKLGKH